mmetsp:Transcript_24192/g.40059  ORF Transcript_24192/g.40059 Transcript_24192/m.40059 type:complete len:242 (+) Transcript_24192:167-892(+)|eukprot:CAMPEP_0119011956 /NCGR_PEP_ID=MMETSP1176-20130426/5988_1 /TAXON_ID=265551 /ORGANISM="Synedropsis recta cf, Strain CCMP1620" /LENGTH=241 /DNA_ID=CAMNT_0006964839 /DNA_START=139 /DNA_END=864 /DNA_ORIENTATION=+
MPKSRRSQVVTLTQTAKKTRDHKASYIQDVRAAIDDHDSLYLFTYDNMRSSKFKQVRQYFRNDNNAADSEMTDSTNKTTGSRIFLGKNKLLQIAMGRTSEEEYHDNLKMVAKRIAGSVGLLCTSRPTKEVQQYFAELGLHQDEYARAGSVCPQRVVLTHAMVATHPVNLLEQYKKLGLPLEVKEGVLMLRSKEDFVLCKEGQTLSAEQCKALVHFGIPLAKFNVQLVCRWNAADGAFEELQ